MRRGTARPRQPALPARLRQLHELRPALHHHRLAAVRPRLHHDGGLPDVHRLCARIPRSRRPAVPRAAGLLPELRADAALPGRRWRHRRRGGTAPGPTAAARRRDTCRQGHRWIPPGMRRRGRARGRRAAKPKAARRQAVRGDGARHGDRAPHRGRRRRVGAGAGGSATADRADAAAGHRSRRRLRCAAQPGPRRHAGLHTDARTSVRTAGRRAGTVRTGDDIRQSRWRADLLHRRRRARPALAPRGRLADARPGNSGAM